MDNVILQDPPLGISPLWTNLQRMLNPQPQPCPGELKILDTVELPPQWASGT